MAVANIAASSSGNNEIVAAHAGKKIRLIAWWLTSNGTVNAKWRSANTDKSGLAYLVANAGVSVPAIDDGSEEVWVETAAGEALNLNLSGAVAVGGQAVYEVG
jgi:hypothetical protein